MDESYIIEQAEKFKAIDIASAKAWIITAKTLYPNNFNVQVGWNNSSKNSSNFFESRESIFSWWKDPDI